MLVAVPRVPREPGDVRAEPLFPNVLFSDSVLIGCDCILLTPQNCTGNYSILASRVSCRMSARTMSARTPNIGPPVFPPAFLSTGFQINITGKVIPPTIQTFPIEAKAMCFLCLPSLSMHLLGFRLWGSELFRSQHTGSATLVPRLRPNLFLFAYQIQFPLPPLLRVPPCHLPSIPFSTTPPSPFTRSKASHRSQQSMAFHVKAGSSSSLLHKEKNRTLKIVCNDY